MYESTALTTVQQQRMEALTAGASLLVDRSTVATSLFHKSADPSMKAGAMSAVDVPEAITLAEYIVRGVDVAPMRVDFTEDDTPTLARDGEL